MAFNLDKVSDGEQISRYIDERKKMKPSTGHPKYNAFMPPANRRLSVCRSQDLSEIEVWKIADEFVVSTGNPSLQELIYPRPRSLLNSYERNLIFIHTQDTPMSSTGPRARMEDVQRVIAIQLANIAGLVQR